MKVEFKTPFAEMTFEMGQPQAVALLRQALEYATYTKSPEATHPPQEAPVEPVEAPVAPVEPEATHPQQAGTRGSRVENLFGNRAGWGGQRGNDRQTRRADGYKGFLYIRCEECGEKKGYNAKFLTSSHKCDACGHRTDLENLRPAFVACKCNRRFKYMTNIQEESFVIPCLDCGAPVDMELNRSGSAFVPVSGYDPRRRYEEDPE